MKTTTITDQIYLELIQGANNPAAFEEVMQKYGHSKGPLYVALAQANDTLTQKYNTLTQQCLGKFKEHQQKQQSLNDIKKNINQTNQDIALKNEEIAALDKKLAVEKILLDQIKKLDELGFTAIELARLHKALDEISSSTGVKPEKVVDVFFGKVGLFGKLKELEAELKAVQESIDKAKAEANQYQLQVQEAEAKSEARQTNINLAEKLLAFGIRETDIPVWNTILMRVGICSESLEAALLQFTSILELIRHYEGAKENLGKEVNCLTEQVQALKEEKEKVSSAITVISDTALAAVDTVSKKTQYNVEQSMNKFGEYIEVEKKAAVLAEEIKAAEAIKTGDPKV